MDTFLKRMGAALSSEELIRYAGILESDPLSKLQMVLFEEKWRDEFDGAVQEKLEERLPEAVKEEIAEKLHTLADELDDMEEAIIQAVRQVSYDDIPRIVEELFDTFNKKQDLRGGE